MASSELVANIKSFITAAATRDKLILTLITGGSTVTNLSALTTTQKGNLVAALNELKSAIDAVGSGGAAIDDTTARTSTVYSSQKTESVVSAAVTTGINQILAGAPTAFDTLKEIADYIASDQTFASSVLTALDNRVRFDAAQTLTAPQKAQALSNIGAASAADLSTLSTNVGDTTTDLAAYYTNLLA